jgi:hypothetical protein
MARSPESAAVLDILDRPDNPRTDGNIDCSHSHPSLGVGQSFELGRCRIEFTNYCLDASLLAQYKK